MKTGKWSIRYSLLALLVSAAMAGFAQGGLISKIETIEKSFDQQGIANLIIQNAYGNIDVSYWDQNKVTAIITIKVIAWDADDAERFIEILVPEGNVIECKCSDNAVMLSTDFSYIKQRCGRQGRKIVYAPWFSKNAEVKQYNIDYKIMIPASVTTLDVSNSFGDINLPDFEGKLSVMLRNGNLRTGNLKLDDYSRGVQVRYGMVTTGNIENARLNLFSCPDVSIGNAWDVNFTSSLSRIQIDSCTQLTLNSKSDIISIGTIQSLSGSTRFSHLEIGKLLSTLDLKNKSGKVEILKIDPEFKKLSLNGEYIIYQLNLNDLSYRLDANVEFTTFDGGSPLIPIETKRAAVEGNVNFKKEIGDKSKNSNVMLKCTNCNIEIK
jgi:hypothetical protein